MGPKLRYIIKVIIDFLLTPFKLFPINDKKIFLLNDIMGFDANYSSNPKYIAEYLLKHHHGEVEIVYALGKDSFDKHQSNEHIKFVKLQSFKYFYHALTSKVFVTTSGGISYLPFREEQIVINSWHGGGAYKKMGLDASEDEDLRKALEISESKTTFFVSSNQKFSEAVQSAFLMPKEKIIDIGLPRNDVFFEEREDIVDKVKQKFGLATDTNIVLYAPTYRSDDESIYTKHILGPYDIDYESVVKACESRFGGKWVFGIRLHPSLNNSTLDLPEDVLDMSTYEDPQELLYTAEVLINDYSSTMWDFSMSRKPCFIYATDLDQYDANLGFYMAPHEWPFPLTTNNKQLCDSIINFDNDLYQRDLELYFDEIGSYENGSATQTIVEILLNSSQ